MRAPLEKRLLRDALLGGPQLMLAAHQDKAEAGFCLPAGFTCTQTTSGQDFTLCMHVALHLKQLS